jgi:hypothetical protein
VSSPDEAADRLRTLLAVVLAPREGDAAGAPRRLTVAEAGDGVLGRLPPGGIGRAELLRLLGDAAAGRRPPIPAAVRPALAGFFGVPAGYFDDGDVARTTDAALLESAFARLGARPPAVCRAGADPAVHHRLLALVLDSALLLR